MPSIILLVVGMFVYIKFYKLSESRMAEIRKQIKPDIAG